MPIQVFPAAVLGERVKDYDAVKGYRLNVPEGTTVGGLVNLFGIPEDQVKVVVVDGKVAKLNTILKGNERVALFPAVAGGQPPENS